jgi:hypothetical protein
MKSVSHRDRRHRQIVLPIHFPQPTTGLIEAVRQISYRAEHDVQLRCRCRKFGNANNDSNTGSGRIAKRTPQMCCATIDAWFG